MNNYFEELLLADLKGVLSTGQLVRLDAAVILACLADTYPIQGSDIDWAALKITEQQYAAFSDEQLTAFIHFFNSMQKKYGLSANVYWVGDSAVDFAIFGNIALMVGVLDKLLSIPQHHYLIAADFKWCMSFRFEGHMFFGYNDQKAG